MAPNPTLASGLLRQIIHYHLDNSSWDNALFFAERLVTQDPKSSEAAHLYALAHLRLGDNRSAYDASKLLAYRGHLGSAWVFAHACLALERYKEGILALEKSKGVWITQKGSVGKHSATSRAAGPDAPAVLCLLGKLCRAYEDKKKAIGYFEEALKLSPFQWDAFTALCDMGVHVRVPNIFRSNDSILQSFDQDTVVDPPKGNTSSNITEPIAKKSGFRSIVAELGPDPFNTSFSAIDTAGSPIAEMLAESADNDFLSKIHSARLRLGGTSSAQPVLEGLETPTGPAPGETATRSISHSHDAPQAPARRTRVAPGADAGVDAPPRMNYRLGAAKRTTRTQDRDLDQSVAPMPDTTAPTATSRSGAAAAATERKRTLSGHPVPRSANLDEPSTRRSARLGTFKPSARVNSGAATIGASAGRELKKARPPISRIVRPGSSGASVGRVVSGNRKPIDDQADMDHGESSRVRAPTSHATQPSQASNRPPPDTDSVKVEEAMKWTLDLLRKLGGGYYHLSRFQCQEALQTLTSLPTVHQGSPWVLAQMGKAYYEQGSYAEAEKFFRKMRVQAPSRLQDMEVYSTILWHLKRETDLSFLAHELVDSAWDSPQAWCALGNAWSLARDPEQALKCFKRATQLNPKFAYAFTLQGHEHVTNEEYDGALAAYRQAISADRRHYNAYYGIGRVQERLGVYDKAYSHFQAAQTINPNNAVLIACIGTVLEKQNQIVLALRAYSKAVELAPRAALTRYKKARALLAVGQIEEAQKELIVLKDLAPDESRVHFLLGTLYRSMNEKQLAVRHFTDALALDPKVHSHLEIMRHEDES